MKTGTKLGFVALALAVGTAMFWFRLAAQVNLPDDRTGFVLVFFTAAALGVAAYAKGTGLVDAFPPAFPRASDTQVVQVVVLDG